MVRHLKIFKSEPKEGRAPLLRLLHFSKALPVLPATHRTPRQSQSLLEQQVIVFFQLQTSVLSVSTEEICTVPTKHISNVLSKQQTSNLTWLKKAAIAADQSNTCKALALETAKVANKKVFVLLWMTQVRKPNVMS